MKLLFPSSKLHSTALTQTLRLPVISPAVFLKLIVDLDFSGKVWKGTSVGKCFVGVCSYGGMLIDYAGL